MRSNGIPIVRNRQSAAAAFGLVVALLCGATAAQPAAGPASRPAAARPQRWAVLAAGTLAATPVADLVTAEMSTLRGVQTVERQALARAADEQALTKALSPEAAGGRQALGRLLGADVLLLLTDERRGDGDVLRAVASDTATGARLAAAEFAYRADQPDAAAADVLGLVTRARARFPQGVRAVVGLTPLLSTSAVAADARHAREFGDLIADGLGSVSGVAVLEVAEARAVAAELATAGPGGAAAGDRVVPLMIDGTYQVMPVAPAAEPGRPAPAGTVPGVRLKLKLSAGGRAIDAVGDRLLPLADAPGFLRGEFRDRVVTALNAGRSPVAADEQYRALVARADAFRAAAEYEDAAALREAALLLKPGAVDQRKEAAFDLAAFARDRVGAPPMGEVRQARVATYYGPRLAALERLADHAEVLVRARAVNTADALSFASLLNNRIVPPATRAACPAVAAVADRQRERTRAFLRTAWPAARAVPPGRGRLRSQPTVAEFRARWTDAYAVCALDSFFPNSPDWSSAGPADLAFLRDALERLVPDDAPAPPRLIEMLARPPAAQNARSGATTPEDHARFVRDLSASPRASCRLYGRFGTLKLNATVGPAADEEAAAILREVDALPDGRERFAPLVAALTSGGPPTPPAVVRPTTRPTTRPTSRPATSRPAGPADGGELVVEVIPRPVIRDASGDRPQGFPQPGDRRPPGSPELSSRYGGARPLPLGPGVDAYWSAEGVAVMRQPGLLVELYASRTTSVKAAAWDGRWLWAADEEVGLVAVDPAGGAVVAVDAAAALPANASVVCAVAPGSVLAAGRAKDSAAGWIALVALAAGPAGGPPAPRVNAFHAARAAGGKQMAIDDPLVKFEPQWIVPDAPGDAAGKGRTFLVGRHITEGSGGRVVYPLRVELDGPRVTVATPLARPDGSRSEYDAPWSDVRRAPFRREDGTWLYTQGGKGHLVWAASPGRSLPGGRPIVKTEQKVGDPFAFVAAPGGAVWLFSGGLEAFRVDADLTVTRFALPKVAQDDSGKPKWYGPYAAAATRLHGVVVAAGGLRLRLPELDWAKPSVPATGPAVAVGGNRPAPTPAVPAATQPAPGADGGPFVSSFVRREDGTISVVYGNKARAMSFEVTERDGRPQIGALGVRAPDRAKPSDAVRGVRRMMDNLGRPHRRYEAILPADLATKLNAHRLAEYKLMPYDEARAQFGQLYAAYAAAAEGTAKSAAEATLLAAMKAYMDRYNAAYAEHRRQGEALVNQVPAVFAEADRLGKQFPRD